MEYPKQVMSISEMHKIGHPVDFLRRAVHSRYGKQFAWQTSRGGKWMIDTQEFEKLKKKGVFR